MRECIRHRVLLIAACLVPLVALAAPAKDSDRSTAVVDQGGATVTLGDVDAYMARIPREKWAGFVSSGDRIETMLRDILRTKQLAAQARELKLDQDPTVKAQIAYAEDDVLAKSRFQAYTDSIKVPDLSQLAKEEYLAHKDQYLIPANVKVQQILISTDGRTDEDARKLANTVRAEAIANPAKFEDFVMKYSDDPQKDLKKGIVKDATSSKLVPPFAKAAGELLVPGSISPIVKTSYGYHILKLIENIPARQRTFDEVKAEILERLDKQYIARQRTDFLNKLSSQDMKPYPDVIASLHDRYANVTGAPVDTTEAAPTDAVPAARRP